MVPLYPLLVAFFAACFLPVIPTLSHSDIILFSRAFCTLFFLACSFSNLASRRHLGLAPSANWCFDNPNSFSGRGWGELEHGGIEQWLISRSCPSGYLGTKDTCPKPFKVPSSERVVESSTTYYTGRGGLIPDHCRIVPLFHLVVCMFVFLWLYPAIPCRRVRKREDFVLFVFYALRLCHRSLCLRVCTKHRLYYAQG